MKKAVITADLIQSTQMSRALRIWLNKKINGYFKTLTDKKFIKRDGFEFFRGDSFQCLIDNPTLALRVALIIKTGIKALRQAETIENAQKEGEYISKQLFDVRLSLAIGEVSIKTKQLTTSDGEAFRLSGRRLDEMKKEKRTFCISTNDLFEKELEMEALFLDTLISKATPLQCEVIYWKIYGYNEIEIAKKLNINQSAVNQRSAAASWRAIEKMIKHFEEMYHD